MPIYFGWLQMILQKIGLKIFGSRNQRMLSSFYKIVEQINKMESQISALSDAQLSAKTSEFKKRLASESLEQILPEAFAVVREASKRTLGLRHYDVQLIGGMILNAGKIVEMCTGEGKTLCATLPAYLNALVGNGVHVVTVNPYLAQRDADWMQPIYDLLGLTVGVIIPDMDSDARRAAYAADITYATNNEIGFDYLRDHMVSSLADMVQRGRAFAIIDEVDSVLIDEARTPLIISGPVAEDTSVFAKLTQFAGQFEKAPHGVRDVNVLEPENEEPELGDFVLDEKEKQIYLTEQGHNKFEKALMDLGIIQQSGEVYDPKNARLLHIFNACLRAQHCFAKDVDYIVADNQVVIVDEHTGRTMPGRRWSDGLHQAIEALEGLTINQESKTLASITFQNYFKLYDKLSGMTGTADTEAYEFEQIYQLEVIVLPTNKPMQRIDQNDLMYLTHKDKLTAILNDIIARNKAGQPVLVGTSSIESSEEISRLLAEKQILHEVLNAKNHAREAEIIANAGAINAVTIATNMAGRGTDIVLGGVKDSSDFAENHAKVKELGGLYVLGAERNESRRIDNQLRGRSGRQGDPGETRFYLSLDDALIRIFATDKVKALITRLSDDSGEALEQPMLTRSIESAQRRVEGHYFTLRKNLLKFDTIIAEQRDLIYKQRVDLLSSDDLEENIRSMFATVIHELLAQHKAEDGMISPESLAEIRNILQALYHIQLQQNTAIVYDQLHTQILELIGARYAEQLAEWGEHGKQLEKDIVLQIMDNLWQDHLSAIENLRMGIHLRGYAQKDPVQEFKKETFRMFEAMLSALKRAIIAQILSLDLSQLSKQTSAAPLKRNADCPCGSGLRYKKCCGKL